MTKNINDTLVKGNYTFIYSEAGVGKSLIAILIAYLLGLKNFENENAEIGDGK